MATDRGERRVEVVQVFGADRPERVLADGRSDVALDHPPVPVGGGGADSTLPFRQPPVGQKVAEGDDVSSKRDRHTVGFGDARRDGFGVGLRCVGCVSSSAFATDGRVDSVIEATVAGDEIGHASVIDLATLGPTRRS